MMPATRRAGPEEPAPSTQAVTTTTNLNLSSSLEDCQPCDHAAREGWWGPGHRGTHCQDCHRSWTGYAEAHCAECHLHFSTDHVAAAHRVGDHCMTLSDLRAVRRESGSPVFDTRSRASGLVVVWWRDQASAQPSSWAR
jgi:hypothetical protein